MEHACLKCRALHWLGEHVQMSGSAIMHLLFGMCCLDGKIHLPQPPPPPNLLKRLFMASMLEARQFHEHIRQYNVALSFTFLGAQVDGSINRGGGGPLVFKIWGELHCQEYYQNSVLFSQFLLILYYANHFILYLFISLMILDHQ